MYGSLFAIAISYATVSGSGGVLGSTIVSCPWYGVVDTVLVDTCCGPLGSMSNDRWYVSAEFSLDAAAASAAPDANDAGIFFFGLLTGGALSPAIMMVPPPSIGSRGVAEVWEVEICLFSFDGRYGFGETFEADCTV